MQLAISSLDRPTGELGFWASLVDVLGQFVRGALLTDEDERRLHLAAFAGSRLGHAILRAESVDDLDDRIDAAIQDPELGRLSALGFRSSGGQALSRPATEPRIAPALAGVFGHGALGRLEEGDRLAGVIAAAAAQLRTRMDPATLVPGAERGAEPLAFLSDPGTPVEVAAGLLGGLRAAACLAAITQASLLRQKLVPWIALALAERWVEGQWALLRLLASMPGVTLPETLVPPEEKLDLEALLASARATEERLQELLEAAKASGETIYPARAEAGDEGG